MTSPKFPYLYELDHYFHFVFAYFFVQNLIDLAGSESSKTETTGLRRKEGSYINKSLLTLGTVGVIQRLYFCYGEDLSCLSIAPETTIFNFYFLSSEKYYYDIFFVHDTVVSRSCNIFWVEIYL